MIEHSHRLNTPPDPFDQGSAEKGVERFLGEPSRGEPGWHDAENLAAHLAFPRPERWGANAKFTPRKLPERGGEGQPGQSLETVHESEAEKVFEQCGAVLTEE